MTIALLIFAAILVYFGLSILLNWLALRLVGGKSSLPSLLKLTSSIVAFQTLISLAVFITKNPVLGGLGGLAATIGGVLIWVKLVQRYYRLDLGRNIAALAITYAGTTVIAAIAAISALNFVQVFMVTGNTMSPTISSGDRVLGYKYDKNYVINDVIIYDFTVNGKNYRQLGRVQGLPGQTVDTSGKGYVDATYQVVRAPSYALQSDELYVVGDDRAAYPTIVKRSAVRAVVGPTVVHAK